MKNFIKLITAAVALSVATCAHAQRDTDTTSNPHDTNVPNIGTDPTKATHFQAWKKDPATTASAGAAEEFSMTQAQMVALFGGPAPAGPLSDTWRKGTRTAAPYLQTDDIPDTVDIWREGRVVISPMDETVAGVTYSGALPARTESALTLLGTIDIATPIGQNTIVGLLAAQNNEDSNWTRLTAVGPYAGMDMEFIGADSQRLGVTTLGYNSGRELKQNSSYSTTVGGEAGRLSYVDSLVAVGYLAGANMSGSSGPPSVALLPTAVGYVALEGATGNTLTGVGRYAGRRSASSSSSYFGGNAGTYNTGGSVTAIGASNLYENKGVAATGVGVSVANYNEGIYVTGVGYQAMVTTTSSYDDHPRTGNYGTAVGAFAMQYTDPYHMNTAVGYNALGYANQEGYNTGIGGSAGSGLIGKGNTYIGYYSGVSRMGTNSTGLGQGSMNANFNLVFQPILTKTTAAPYCLTVADTSLWGAVGDIINIGGAGTSSMVEIIDGTTLCRHPRTNLQFSALWPVGQAIYGFSTFNNSTGIGSDAEVDRSNQVKLGNTAVTEVWTHGVLRLTNEVLPTPVANNAYLASVGGELNGMDAAGNITILTPHEDLSIMLDVVPDEDFNPDFHLEVNAFTLEGKVRYIHPDGRVFQAYIQKDGSWERNDGVTGKADAAVLFDKVPAIEGDTAMDRWAKAQADSAKQANGYAEGLYQETIRDARLLEEELKLIEEYDVDKVVAAAQKAIDQRKADKELGLEDISDEPLRDPKDVREGAERKKRAEMVKLKSEIAALKAVKKPEPVKPLTEPKNPYLAKRLKALSEKTDKPKSNNRKSK